MGDFDQIITDFLRAVQADLGDDILLVSVFDVPSVAFASQFIGALSFGEHHPAGGWLPPNRMRAHVVEDPTAASIHIAGTLEVAEAKEIVEEANSQGWKAQVNGIGPNSKKVARAVPGTHRPSLWRRLFGG